jgi:hypothetical protein
MNVVIAAPPERGVTVEGLAPGVKVAVTVQNTAQGGTAVFLVTADEQGSAKLQGVKFDSQNWGLSLRILIAGQDTIVHSFMFDGPNSMIDTKDYHPEVVVVPAPPAVPTIYPRMMTTVTNIESSAEKEPAQGEVTKHV